MGEAVVGPFAGFLLSFAGLDLGAQRLGLGVPFGKSGSVCPWAAA
jgi:hypothetical protein